MLPLQPQCYEIKYKLQEKKKLKKTQTHKRLNNTFLNNQQVTEEIKREIKKILEANDNENRIAQNLRDVAKAVPRRKFIAIQPYLRKQEKYQIDKLILYLKQLEKEKKNQWKEKNRKTPRRNK